jgi:hypothetical protein
MGKEPARLLALGLAGGVALGGLIVLNATPKTESSIEVSTLSIVGAGIQGKAEAQNNKGSKTWRPMGIDSHPSAYHFVTEFELVNNTRPQAGSGALVGELFQNPYGLDINFISVGTRREFKPLGDADIAEFRSNLFNPAVASKIHVNLDNNKESIGQAVSNIFTNLKTDHRVTWRLAPFMYAGVVPVSEDGEFKPLELVTRREIIETLAPMLPKVSQEYINILNSESNKALLESLPVGEREGWLRFQHGLNPIGATQERLTVEQFYDFANSYVTRGEVMHLMYSVLGQDRKRELEWGNFSEGMDIDSPEEYKDSLDSWASFMGDFKDNTDIALTSPKEGIVSLLGSGKMPYEYASGVYHFVSVGLMSGNSAGELRLGDPITRQDLIYVLYRMIFEGV